MSCAMTLYMLFVFIFCLFLTGTTIDLQDLQSLEDRIVNPSSKTATLSATTLASSESLVALLDVAVNPIVITNIDYGLNPKTKELDISGNATLFGAVDANVYFAAFVADPAAVLGASLRVTISAGWQMPALWPNESWLHSLTTVDANGFFSLSSTERTLDDGSTLEKAVVIDLQHAGFSSDSLSLSRLLGQELSVIKLRALLRLPLTSVQTPSAMVVHEEQVEALLSVDAALSLFVHSNVRAASLRMHVVGIQQTPTFDVQVVVSMEWAQSSPLKFDAAGRYTANADTLLLQANLETPWTHPFNFRWLSIQDATARLSVIVASPSQLSALDISGKASISVHDYIEHCDVQVHAVSKCKELVLEASPHLRRLSDIVLAALSLPASTASYLDNFDLLDLDVDLVIATNDASLNGTPVRAGLSLTGKALLGGILARSLSGGESAAVDVAFQVHVPPHSSALSDVAIYLTVDARHIGTHLDLLDIHLRLNAEQHSPVVFDSQLVLRVEPEQDVHFQLSGDYAYESNSLHVKGAMTNDWNRPLGLEWIEIKSSAVSLSLAPTGLRYLNINSAALLHFKEANGRIITVSSAIHGEALDNLGHYKFRVPFELDSVSPVVSTVLGVWSSLRPSNLDWLEVRSELVLTITSNVGIELRGRVRVASDSPLLHRLQVLAPSVVPDVDLQLLVRVPVHLPLDGLVIQLNAAAIDVRPNIRFDGVTFGLELERHADISIDTGVSILFARQSSWVDFGARGSITVQGEFSITGAMKGEWKNVFGLSGLDFGNAFVEIGFSPTGLRKIGIGAETSLGESSLQFDGIVDVIDWTNLYLFAKVEHLSLVDLSRAFNKFNPTSKVDPQILPDLIDFKELQLSLAPTSASVDIGDGHVVEFIAGLAFSSNLNLFGVNLVLRSELLLDKRPFDFEMYAHYDDGSETSLSLAFLGALLPNHELQPPPEVRQDPTALALFNRELSFTFFHLKEITLDEFSTVKISKGISPRVTMLLDIFDTEHVIEFRLRLPHFHLEFKQLLQSGHLNLPQALHLDSLCISDVDCAEGKHCQHERGGNWHCVDTCPSHSGRVPLVGCTQCLSSAECTGPNNLCEHGECVKPGSTDFSGMCDFQRSCSRPESGCLFGFCRRCSFDWECRWSGVAGPTCTKGICVGVDAAFRQSLQSFVSVM